MTILLAEELKRRNNLKHCLIVCGVNSLKYNWKKEIAKHSNLSCRILGERVNRNNKSVISSVSDRCDELKQPINEFFIITNIETLRDSKIIRALKKSTKNQIDMMVVDEIHCCKGPSSQQSSNLLKLDKIRFKLGLTGTLLLNNPLDVYVPLK